MLRFVAEMLQCPACEGTFDWQIERQQGERIQEARARCKECGSEYPVHEEIGYFLGAELPREDLWEQGGSGMKRFFAEQPQIETQLMEAPLESLSPADQFYRALALEERGEYDKAKSIFEAVKAGLYTPEYLICMESQVHYLIAYLAQGEGPVVDLASGRGELVQEMARRLQRPVIATDFSPRVLRRDRDWLRHFSLYERVSLLALDARQTPFKSGAVGTMTSLLGISNIQSPGSLFEELRRVVSGELLAISIFYPEADERNARKIRSLNLTQTLFRSNLRRRFLAAGWKIAFLDTCQGRAVPTPASLLLTGAQIDSLPVKETELQWCTLQAR